MNRAYLFDRPVCLPTEGRALPPLGSRGRQAPAGLERGRSDCRGLSRCGSLARVADAGVLGGRGEAGRKCTALDWMAVAVEEHGREIVEVYLEAMRKGDWRAAEALMSRINGKPTDTVVTHTPA
jgi:hypothetical protein